MKKLFEILSHAPLWVLHVLGCVLGLCTFFSPSYRRHLFANAAVASVSRTRAFHALLHAGCAVAELPRLWLGAPVPVRRGIRDELAQAFALAGASNTGLIFLTPHLGAWEVAGQQIAAACNAEGLEMTVMYRPSRKAWLTPLIQTARSRPGMRTVPAGAAGVRATLQALKHRQAIGLLPDQVPPQGQGVWARFFGRAAYTVSLPARLIQSSGAVVVLVWCERLHWGAGYALHTQILTLSPKANLQTLVQQINAAVERVILQRPQQYLWGYARYKTPRVVHPDRPSVPAHGGSEASSQ